VVFDVDDTLYLERDYVRSGLLAVDDSVRGRFGVSGVFAAAWEDFLGGRRGDLIDRALVAVGLRPEAVLVTSLLDCYRTHVPAIGLLPDAAAALRTAQATGSVAVITDGPAASQLGKVKALGLSTWACPVVVTSLCFPGRPKPDPASFAWVQRALGVPAEGCTYVADNPMKDFAGPKALGWHTVRVRRPGSLHEALDAGEDVDLEVGSLAGFAGLAAGLTAGIR
jgi:putative hydrolase of the HAD superfamily